MGVGEEAQCPSHTPLHCGRVLFVTANDHITALNVTTGKPVWDEVFVDIYARESATRAPRVVMNLVLVYGSGAKYGMHEHMVSSVWKPVRVSGAVSPYRGPNSQE